LNGNALKKLFHQILPQLCTEIDLIQETSNKEPWETVGSLVLFLSKVQTLNY
jgi:hypothetical protein